MLEQFTPIHLIFYFFAAVAAGSAVSVITARNPVRSVLSLVVTFFAMAGIWMLMEAEFLSLILLLVYVGAVMTLFLFVVMMLNIDREQKHGGFVRFLPFYLLVLLVLAVSLFAAVGSNVFGSVASPAAAAEDYSNLSVLGAVLYTDYVYPFELSGVILLASIIAAITLTFRGPVRRKVQNPAAQVSVKREDCVRLVKMEGSST